MSKEFILDPKDKMYRYTRRPDTKEIVKGHLKAGYIMANPKTYYGLAKRYSEGKGFTLPKTRFAPETRYMGPGNLTPDVLTKKSAKEDLPTSIPDYFSYLHDKSYERMLKDGHSKWRVYGGYHESDRRLQEQMKSHFGHPHATLGWIGMESKHILGKTGLIEGIEGY